MQSDYGENTAVRCQRSHSTGKFNFFNYFQTAFNRTMLPYATCIQAKWSLNYEIRV